MRALGCSFLILLLSVENRGLSADPDARQWTVGAHIGYLVKTERADAEAAMRREWHVEPIGIPGLYRLSPHGDAPGRLSPAAAWERVHALRRSGVFEFVEPLFIGQLEPLEAPLPVGGECEPAYSGWKEAPDDNVALNDSQWSLRELPGANVLDAWELLKAKGIQPGAGVAIGHPDTGFLEHPSLRDALLGLGFDFTLRRGDAVDVADRGFLQWPGHGTRTGSVIAGRPFKVKDGQYPISGVAPAAELMPLRVANRVFVLQFLDYDMGNLALAIHAAAIGDPNFVERKADIISMSLGGTPSRAVQAAVKTAEAQNVIVLAAAGNKVPGRRIGFPAAYPHVMAIAATNSQSHPWEGTSRGSRIAFAAPGENVWTAKRRYENETTYDCAEIGTGTSYAVATSAGVAALWISYHRGTEPFESSKTRSATFRALARATARRPSTWDDAQFGPGIVNAKALLERPLAAAVTATSSPACDDLEALGAAMGGRYDAAAALLFGHGAVERACRVAEHLGDEAAFAVAANRSLQAAMERYSLTGGLPDAIVELRNALLTSEISPTLRTALARARVN